MPFTNPIVAGKALIRQAIQSPNYVAGTTGWSINRDGTAEFAATTLRGSFSTGVPGQKRITIDATGTYPTIYFYPASGTNDPLINAPTDDSMGGNSGLGTNTYGNSAGTRWWLHPTFAVYECVTVGGLRNGGYLQIQDTASYLACADASGNDITNVILGQAVASLSAYSGVTQRSRLYLGTNGDARLESFGGSNYVIVGAPGNNYLEFNGGTATISSSGPTQIFGGTTAYIGDASGDYVYLTSGAATLNANGGSATVSGGTVSVTSTSGAVTVTPKTNFVVATPSGGQAKIGSGNVAGGDSTWVAAPTVDLGTGNASDIIRSNSINARTTASAANVNIGAAGAGILARSTSSRRYKVEIEGLDVDPYAALELRPVTFYDRTMAEAQGGSTEGLSHQVGLIAEDVATISGLGNLLTEPDDDGNPETVNYERVAVVLIPIIRGLVERVADLESRLSVLESQRAA